MAQKSTATSAQLDRQRIAMEKRSSQLQETLRMQREGLHVEQAADLLDNLQLSANREFQLEQLNRVTKELSLVQQALDSIDEGLSGLCIDCEGPISQKRLEVVPWAVRCIGCQSSFEESSNTSHEEHAWELQAER